MKSKVPVVVSFHADWCDPCHTLRPLLEDLVKAAKGKVYLAEVNTCPIRFKENSPKKMKK